MKILIVTDSGQALGLADRLVREDHEVQVYSRRLALSDNGIWEVSTNLQKSLNECAFCVSDIEAWQYLDRHAKHYNRAVVGSNALATVPNTDAYKQYILFDRYGLPTPRTEVLHDVSDAIENILHWDANRTIIRYADREFRCEYRDWLAWGIMRVPVNQTILFQQLVYGSDYLLTGWFDGLDWMDTFTISPDIDTKLYKYAAVAPVKADRDLVTGTLKKLTHYFRKCEYKGPVHLKLTIKASDIYAQTMHIGMDFPLDYTILESIKSELGKFLYGVASSNSFKAEQSRDFVSAVQSICTGEDMAGAPILGLNDERLKHIAFHNISKDKEGNYYISEGDREVVTATAHGPSIDEMCDRVYETVEGVKFPEKHYNANLKGHVSPMFEQLKTWRHI